MKYFYALFLFVLPLALFANTLKEGSAIEFPSIKDQFEKKVLLTAQTKQVIVAFTQAQGSSIKSFLEKNPNYLAENNAIYIMDATAVPSMVMSLFMMPKFKKYSYSIGLLEDKKDVAYFPKKEEHMTIIQLDNFTVSSVTFKETF
ncbi:hypothetical protein [Sulfurospirillum barnesii]|uniref:FAD/FMN-containing dehydrogenase n=1 Tax=Sulfurospirillum barnesii (strain ATCC 700032 / DSM 10660 / SES-3) TaxID=760154 RepID=I3XV34_SULBS|nr:hypothetical protein [Sulfurospirillum barnesii]AFL67808.1 hypothetical protein Sulba_0490 [Sulfurospirillum barnesii SES-3]